MTGKLQRRDLVKTVAAAGGLLALGRVAFEAQTTATDGRFILVEKHALDQLCALRQRGED